MESTQMVSPQSETSRPSPSSVDTIPSSRWMKLLLLLQCLHVTASGEESSKTDEDPVVDVNAVALPEDDTLAKVKLPRQLPSILEIKKIVPPHCFESSVSTSTYYLIKDAILIALTYALVEWTWEVFPPIAQVAITPLFWLVQGTFFTAIFVVGHDAGHGSFSSSEVINTLCGNFCHTFLMCPYYMWKVSHRKHHKNTGNIDKDEVFYPLRKKDDTNTKLLPLFGFGVGWFAYLVKGYKPRGVQHFNPLHPMFHHHVFNCTISLACIVGWSMCVFRYYEAFGLANLFYHYAVPLFIFASYTVIITFLHHTEDDIPWYGDHLWNNVRGQLSSVDRSYGWCHFIIHSIGTHQIHHLFPKVPHYHLEEATTAFRKAFPKLVNVRSEPILPAFWRMFKKYANQNIIGDDVALHMYK